MTKATENHEAEPEGLTAAKMNKLSQRVFKILDGLTVQEQRLLINAALMLHGLATISLDEMAKTKVAIDSLTDILIEKLGAEAENLQP